MHFHPDMSVCGHKKHSLLAAHSCLPSLISTGLTAKYGLLTPFVMLLTLIAQPRLPSVSRYGCNKR